MLSTQPDPPPLLHTEGLHTPVLIHTGKVEGELVRRRYVNLRGRKYQHDWLYLHFVFSRIHPVVREGWGSFMRDDFGLPTSTREAKLLYPIHSHRYLHAHFPGSALSGYWPSASVWTALYPRSLGGGGGGVGHSLCHLSGRSLYRDHPVWDIERQKAYTYYVQIFKFFRAFVDTFHTTKNSNYEEL